MEDPVIVIDVLFVVNAVLVVVIVVITPQARGAWTRKFVSTRRAPHRSFSAQIKWFSVPIRYFFHPILSMIGFSKKCVSEIRVPREVWFIAF